MSTSPLDRELLKDYTRRLNLVKTLLTTETPSPDSPLQAIDNIEFVLVGLQAFLTRSSWPEPTTDEPDLDMLEVWMIDDGGCEATDGCWVEPDGRCPHGHPSWFVVLGLI